MREPEFLPDWYPKLRRRRRMVLLQMNMTLVIAAGLAAGFFLLQRNVRMADAALQQLGGQMSQTQSDLAKLNELLELQKQWGKQAQIASKLGIHVGAARLLATLDTLMPPQMSMLDISLQTEEQLSPAAQVSALAAARAAQSDQPIDRRLRVKLLGVAPTDEDVANFLARLSTVSFFEQVSMSYSRDRVERGHTMREFEVTFTLTLNLPGSN